MLKVRNVIVAALVMGVACGRASDGPPQIEVDQTKCAHCGMLISERVYAAGSRAEGESAAAFDDIACMLDAARAKSNADRLQMWVHDAATREWIDAREAVFVKSVNLRTPMGGGVIAFRDRSRAQAAATQHAGQIIASIEELVSQHGRKEPGGKQ